MRNEIISAIIGGLASGALCGIAISYVIKVSKETLEHHMKARDKEILDLRSEIYRLELEVQRAENGEREANGDRMRLMEELSRLNRVFRSRANTRKTEDNELVIEAVKKAMMDNHPDRSGDSNTSEKFMAYNKLYKEMRGK